MAMDMEVDEEMMPMGMNVQDLSLKRRSSLKGKGRLLQHDEQRAATLHRIRFLDYMPSSILAIALTPQSYDPSIHHPYLPSLHTGNGREILAVGRQNGEIEIYIWIGGEGAPKNTQNGKGKRRTSVSTPINATNKQGWVLERRLAPPSPSRVEHLLFTHQTILSEDDYNLCEDDQEVRKELANLRKTKPRLFTSGGGSDLWEWEWSNSKEGGLGYVKKSLPSQGGAIWSIAANPSSTTLALGCDDGAVRLVNLWDGALEMLRKFDSTKTRLLSVAWGPQQAIKKPKQKSELSAASNHSQPQMAHVQYQDSYIVTGCADSTVRKWDVKTGRSTARMTTDKVKGENTLVWSVAVIAGHSLTAVKAANNLDPDVIVSGDSMGLVKFWDEKTNTQIESLACHKSDILCLAVGPDGKSVYASGVDQVVSECLYTKVKIGGQTRSGRMTEVGKWVHTHSRRLHAHDVRAITVSPSYSALFPSKSSYTPMLETGRVPIVVSGGYDFSLIFTPAATPSTVTDLRNPVSDSKNLTFSGSTQRKASYVPQRSSSLISLAREAGILAERTLQGMNLWSLTAVNKSASTAGEQQYSKLLEMELNTQTNLISSAVSDDGRWLAASDAYETRLWKLKTGPDGSIHPRRIASLSTALGRHPLLKDYEHHAASHLHFTNDSSKLVLATVPGSYVAVIQLPESKHEDATVLRVFSQHRSRSAHTRALAGRSLTNGAGEGDEADSDNDCEEEEDSDEIVPSVACMTTSSDGQWLLTGDMTGRLHVFNLDSLQYHAALPSVELPPVDMAFSPSNASIAVVALPNNTIQIFDVDQRTIPTWAHSISRNLFASFTNLREPILGLAFDPVAKSGKHVDTLVLYGSNYIGTMKISPSEGNDSTAHAIEKRKRDGDVTVNGVEDKENTDEETDTEATATKGRSTINVTYKYQPILFVDFASQGDMVVVEKPYFSMLSQMAPAFSAKKYGKS